MLAVGRLAVALRRGEQRFFCNPAIFVGDLLRRGDLHALMLFHHAHEVRRVQQRFHRARIQPGKAAPKQLHVQALLFQVHGVERGDFQFTPH